MESYQERVVEEKQALDLKLAKLVGFCGTREFASLPTDEQRRMKRQWREMEGYSEVLGERIDAFVK